MKDVILFLFEKLLEALESKAAKTETKVDDQLVAMLRASFEAYKGANK